MKYRNRVTHSRKLFISTFLPFFWLIFSAAGEKAIKEEANGLLRSFEREVAVRLQEFDLETERIETIQENWNNIIARAWQESGESLDHDLWPKAIDQFKLYLRHHINDSVFSNTMPPVPQVQHWNDRLVAGLQFLQSNRGPLVTEEVVLKLQGLTDRYIQIAATRLAVEIDTADTIFIPRMLWEGFNERYTSLLHTHIQSSGSYLEDSEFLAGIDSLNVGYAARLARNYVYSHILWDLYRGRESNKGLQNVFQVTETRWPIDIMWDDAIEKEIDASISRFIEDGIIYFDGFATRICGYSEAVGYMAGYLKRPDRPNWKELPFEWVEIPLK